MRSLFTDLSALAIGAAAALSVTSLTEKESSWELVYANDADGNSLEGSKDELIEAVREGRPIRVYWRGRRVEHVVDSHFVTILSGEVFVQTPTIRGQRPFTDPARIELAENGAEWTGLFGTNGGMPLRWFVSTE